MLRIVSIDNLSAAAYRLCKPDSDRNLRYATPTRVHELVAGGHCDAALLPVASLPQLTELVEPLGNFGLACRGPVQSVQLFSTTSLEHLLRHGQPIYATPESRTSIALFALLCRCHYGITPALTDAYPRAAARLLIGDEAYKLAHTHPANEHNVDLSAWWLAHTGLPFVFARWVVSKALGAEDRIHLTTWLAECARLAATPEGLSTLAGDDPDGKNDSSRRAYYQQLRLCLDQDDVAGQDLFLQLMESTRYERTARIA